MLQMGRKLTSLTLDNVADLPGPCRYCTLWELGGSPGYLAAEGSAAEIGGRTKDEWLSAVLLDWGSCGRILYVDGSVAGFAMYAPPEYAEGAGAVMTSAVSDDAVLLMTVRILPPFAGGGLGRVLVQSVVKDLTRRRGIRAVEAFGDAQAREHRCLTPTGFLTAVGFRTVEAHPRYPRLRLDLRTVVSWRDDVEGAVERWLGAIRPARIIPEKGTGPIGVSPREELTRD